ncbi:hypothetical protein ACFP47_09225 [Nesterenkonia lacusekhoensis]|uniref:Uncharacterized protein n=1 Tax=Nesterenkonia lacusekhoensis TaxID=150832 RepID=A0ABS4SYY0_9MICC|nr:hypothetical protein [Nesterenkonia lacusekhoensis]MBP2317402.1 hypothetical protein [Nesterenkonia lacusekhoensis]
MSRRVLAMGKIKFAVLTTAPANPEAPTATELNEGIDASCLIRTADFNFSAQASTTQDVTLLCQKNQANAPTQKQHQSEFTYDLYFDEDGRSVPPAGEISAEDQHALHAALREYNEEIYVYARETSKDSAELWEAGDEIYMGGSFLTDVPQRQNGDDFIKRHAVLLPQIVHDNIEVAEDSDGGGEEGN